MRVLESYLASLERGVPARPEELFAQHPDLAEPLREYLASLEFLHRAAANLRSNEPVSKASPGLEGPELGQLGDFRLLREIGRGGMGVVYEAEQISLSRRVALKVLPFAAALDSKQLQRFKNEAQAAAHLHHTNIVPVFGVGCERGVHYYAMQFIEGLTLAAVITELRQEDQESKHLDVVGTLADRVAANETRPSGLLSPIHYHQSTFFRTAANLGLQAAEALEHAHELGVVHRDIKPANLLVDEPGNLWITDFGLAHCQSQAGLTLSGDLVGTLRYMSPEQALGKRGLVDHRADIYSLGVTLYELVTLEPAFGGSDREELLRQIAFDEPPPPRQRNKAIPRELETIVLKAIEKSPEARYATAQELADDLRRFLEHKPIQARRPTMLQRAAKWCRRNPRLAGALTAVAVSLVMGTVVAWLLALWALAERDRADDKAAEAQKEAERARRQAYTANIRLLQQAWDSHNLVQFQSLLDDTAEFLERGFEWYYWQRLSRVEHLTLVGHSSAVAVVAFAPDGHRVVTGGKDGMARMWDADDGRELLWFSGHRSDITAVAFAPNGQWIVTGSMDRTARVWDAASGRELRILEGQNSGAVRAVAVTPDGKRIVTGCEDGTARVLDATSGRELLVLKGQMALPGFGASIVGLMSSPELQLPLVAASSLYCGRTGHTAPIWSVAVTADGRRLLTGSVDQTVRVWDAASGRQLLPPLPQEAEVTFVAMSPDGQRLVTGSGIYGVVKIWDAATSRVLAQIGATTTISSVTTSPDGKHVVTGYAYAAGQGKVWDLATGRELLTLQERRLSRLTCLAVTPDGRRVATGCSDGATRIWDLVGGRGTRTLLTGHNDVYSLAVTPDGKRIITGSRDGTARVWDAVSGGELLKVRGGEPLKIEAAGHWLSCVAITPDGQRMVTGNEDGTAKIWDAVTGQELNRLIGHAPASRVCSIAVTPDGQQIVTGGFDYTARVWDASSGRQILPPLVHPARVHSVSVSADGQQLVTGGQDHVVRLWDLATGRELLSRRGQNGEITCVTFTPDGERFVTGGLNGTATIWQTATGNALFLLKGHTGPVDSVAVTPNGERIVTGGSDGTVRLWDAVSGREVLVLKGHTGGVGRVAVSLDGRRIITGSGDGTVKIWEAATPEQVALWSRQEQEVEHRLAEAETRASPWERPAAGTPGFVHDWLVLAPLPLKEDEAPDDGLEREHVPGEARLEPRAGKPERVEDKVYTWQDRHEKEPVLDFNALVGKMADRSVAYAVCYVNSEREQADVQLQVGTDDEAKVYLNGQLVYKYAGRRPLVALDPVGPITLHKGTNVVLFKVVNEHYKWECCARFLDRDGNPAKDLHVRLTPE
jgi:WD40 repeat protein/serine/threonine protein kinase